MSTPPGVNVSVLRALHLLECYVGLPTASLADLVRLSGLSKTTTHRLAATLVEAGWLHRTDEGRYALTLTSFRPGQSALAGVDLGRDALPIIRRLARDTGDSVYLMVPEGYRALCLNRIDGDSAIRIADLVPGGSQELHLGAGPRAILAFRDDLLPALLRHGLDRRTDRTLTDPDELLADLAAIRERGYSISRGDVTAGVGAFGAPVFAVDGRCVAAVSVGGLLERVTEARQDALTTLLLGACAELSHRLGHSPTGAHDTSDNHSVSLS